MKYLLILTSIIFFSGCSKYPGYKKLTSDIYYSLRQFGEPAEKAVAGDYLTINIEYRTQQDSVFFSGVRKVKINKPEDETSVDNCFLAMKQGDSASFIIPAVKFFSGTLKRSLPEFIKEDEVMKMNVRLMEIQSETDFLIEKEHFLKWSDELSEYEKVLLNQFLAEEKPGIKPKKEGFYMFAIREGKGKKISKGDHIWVHYEGKFLNGKFFDGTYRSHEPIDFIYGTQFMLISGLEHALAYMSEGEKSMIILPSELAFGEKGDEYGIIPPYTSLIYTLEVIKIE
jgi:FKBP-type peptidyl-prolyl cis-trans isomerase